MLIPPSRYYCLAWNRIYIKANGRIPCWCDAGEPHTILQADLEHKDFVLEVLNSSQMREMRLHILDLQEAYNTYCQQCCFFHTLGRGRNFRHRDFVPETKQTLAHKISVALATLHRVAKGRKWPYGSIDDIAEIQFEPSFACNLHCPGCLHGWHPNPMKSETKPYFLPLEWFTSIIRSMKRHTVRLRKASFIGRGEPTLNKHFPAMLRELRKCYPSIFITMDTNATQPFDDAYLLANWINCSIDGSTEEAYKAYRYGGEFLDTIKFMRTAVYRKAATNSRCRIIWKYILFNTSESIELMNLAQRMAKDLGIDELHFVITAAGSADGSVTPAQHMNEINIIKAYWRANPIFNRTMVVLS